MRGNQVHLNPDERNARDEMIWEMRTKNGRTLPSIAAALDLAVSTVHVALERQRKLYRTANLEDIGRIIEDECAALDDRIEHLTELAIAGESWAYPMLLKFRESRRKLLGVDQPVKVEVSGTISSPVDDELAELAAELGLNDTSVVAAEA